MATPPNSHTLAGQRVLICRPEPEATRLAQAFQAAGADTEVLPLLEREPLAESAEQRQLILNLDQFHHVIAVSPYAARLLLERLDTWWPQPPVGIHWYGVGQGTVATLNQAGLAATCPEQGHNSEALLSLPSLQALAQQKVLLVRGDNGRELLREELQRRGAQISVLPLYQRRCPERANQQLPDRLRHFDPHVVITLSGETLNNFIALGENSDHTLYQRLLVVPVQRVADQATAAGFRNVCIPQSLNDDAVVTAVTRHLKDASEG